MTSRKIEMNINEIVNVDENKEEQEQEEKNNMSSNTAAINHIVSSTIHVTQAQTTNAVTELVSVSASECKICCEKYNKSNHVPIKCTSCEFCLLYTSPSPRDRQKSRMPSSA